MDNDQVPSTDSEQPAEQLDAQAAETSGSAGQPAESADNQAQQDKSASQHQPSEQDSTAEQDKPAGQKPARRTRARKAAEATGDPAPVTGDSAPPTEDAAPAKRTPRKKKSPAETPASDSTGETEQRGGSSEAGTAHASEHQDGQSVDPQHNQAGGQPAGHAAERQAAAQAAPPAASPVSVLFQAPDLSEIRSSRAKSPTASKSTEEETADSADETPNDDDSGNRRRRNRRSRNRSRNRDDGNGNAVNSEQDDESETAQEQDETNGNKGGSKSDGSGNEAITSRRRRRRRRGESDLELTGGNDDDPPNTVTRVRAPRQHSEAPASERVTSVKGSTRLEAKKQRRRESRESGRRRQVITEAEFLARRESVDRTMVVRQRDDRIQIGVLEDGVLAEHFVSKTQQDSLIGNVYVGKVQNVLPSMEAAFVDIGRGRNAVLYAGEVNWAAAGMGNQPRKIENALKSGDSVVVQVTKDPVGHKGARLTSQVSLPGRYLVYVPGGSMTGISRKLPDVERNRLKKILKDRLPDNAGVIVRTAAEGASEEELTNDINRLRALWESIESNSTSNKTVPPELLYAEPDLTIKVVRDVFNEDFSKLIISGEDAWDTIEAYVTYVAPDLVSRLEKWTKDEDIFTAWRIDEQITKALERKVFLPSGGSLVIDRTEAMTVVDVNTGKFTGSGGNLEETVTKNNLEAAEEVVRQLRLRDIGGIIVIDFIDMVLESNRDLVLRRMVECLGRDRTKHQVAEVTSLGLVQMTRKRMGTGLLEVFGEACEHCAGRGVVTHDEPVEHHKVDQGHHQQHLRAEKQSRSEKKRNRKQRQQENQPPAPKQGNDDTSESERQAKAEAARAALANIAAASHAAHEHDHPKDDAAASEGQQSTGDYPSDQSGGENGTVLTIQGEPVVVPKSDASEAAQATDAPRFTLESLTEAFESQSGGSDEGAAENSRPAERQSGTAEQQSRPAEQKSGQDNSPKQKSGSGSSSAPQPATRRPRKHRSARSAQGAANASPVETYDDEALAGSTKAAQDGSGSTGAEQKPAARKPKPASEPMVLGTGVPASEL
ncbi:MAG TPA: Rne/Rng family ribonuclease [Arthrobacter sp.]|nr:Rne/Rng family ribonuclease [Arthrobacter sp.]